MADFFFFFAIVNCASDIEHVIHLPSTKSPRACSEVRHRASRIQSLGTYHCYSSQEISEQKRIFQLHLSIFTASPLPLSSRLLIVQNVQILLLFSPLLLSHWWQIVV